jgi:hypothetical protein
MTTPALLPQTEILASFFKRLEGIESIVRVIISEARIRALLVFRGDPEKKVLLDFSGLPARVVYNGQASDADILVTIRAEIMHQVLSGQMAAGTALGRRELLLRGSASHLASLIPLFDFGPVLYREHLEKIGVEARSRPSSRSESEEESMDNKTFNGDPISLVELSVFEKAVFGALNGISYALGYCVGLVRYRLLTKMNLFDVLSAMSRGLAAAAPQGAAESSTAGD